MFYKYMWLQLWFPLLFDHRKCENDTHTLNRNIWILYMDLWWGQYWVLWIWGNNSDWCKTFNIFIKNKYSKPIGWFLITWPSIMVHTDSKYHIDKSIFSFIYCHHGVIIVTSSKPLDGGTMVFDVTVVQYDVTIVSPCWLCLCQYCCLRS